MRSKIIVLCLFCSMLPLAKATAADVSFDGSLGLYSSFILRGYKLSDDALQMQPSATMSTAHFSLNVWATYDSDTEEWLEIDYTASYAHDLDAVGLEFGFIHYDVRDGLDSDEIFVSAGFDTVLNPSLTAYIDINEGQGGFIVADISHPIELNEKTSLEFGASISLVVEDPYVATDAFGNEFTGFFNGNLSAAGSFALNERLSLEPMVGYTFALSDDASDAIKAGSSEPEDSFLYGAVTLSFSF